MKKLLLLFILIFSMNHLHAEKIAWKIQDSLSYSSIKSMSFSDNGDTLVVNNGNQQIFLNSHTGQEIKRLNSKMLFLISNDFCFGVTSTTDSFYVVSTYTGDTISSFFKEQSNKPNLCLNMIFSPDNKYIITSFSTSEYNYNEIYFKSESKINLIDTKTGALVKTLFKTQNDSLGYVDCLFFDNEYSNSLYFSSHYLNVDSLNEIVFKKSFALISD